MFSSYFASLIFQDISHLLYDFIEYSTAQYDERILSKIAKALNKTLPGQKNVVWEFQIYFAWNHKLKGI